MTIFRTLVAGFCLLVSSALASQRVEPTDLGLSVWVPDGWVLERDYGESSYRFYTLYDSTLRGMNLVHSSMIQLEVFSGALASSGTSRQWVLDEALVREYYLKGECFSTILASDTMLVDGVFARKIHGRAANCYPGSNEFSGPIKDLYSRVTASGDIGWVMSYQGDTADVDTAALTYLKILDSIKLDLGFSSIPAVDLKPRFHELALLKVVSEANMLRINLSTRETPRIQVMDLLGRNLPGRLGEITNGEWTWRPDRPVEGMVAVRVRSGVSEWWARAILPHR